jgi:cytoskeletal protein CcmA (bactofilin family)
MGETYTRQSSSTIVDGATIEASHFNAEFDQLLAAFQASTGHTHDGTANEGGPITKLLGNTLTFGAGTAGTDIAITFDGETSDGVLKWMEDEDYFEFSDDILVASTEKLQFRDTAIYINSSTDGQLDLVADTEIQIAATTVDINGNVDVSGTLTVGGALDFSDANITNIGSIALDTITNDGTDITLDSSGDIILDADGADVFLKDAGTTYGSLTNSSGNLIIKSGTTTALTFSGADATLAGDLTISGDDLTMGTNTSGHILVADGTNYNPVAISGDVTLASNGAITIASTAVENSMLAGSIADSKLNTITTADKVSGAAVQVDGATDGTSITVADSDKFLIDDGGTTKYINASQLNTYVSAEASSVAADNISTGDAAVTVATSAGNITIDAQGSDTDIIFKGTDGSSDITALTLDMSAAGAATFNDKIIATELDISGNVDVDGTLEADAITVDGATLTEFITDAVGGMVSSNTETGISVTFEDGDNTLDFVLGSSQTAISSLTNTSLVIGRDADNDIDFATDNTILFRADGADQIKLINGALAPVTNNDIDLGTSSLEFKDAFFDGTVTADAFAGPLTGNVTGNVSGTAATVTGAAQSNITSLGTLTTLTVDNVIINGTTIGHTDDTDLITLADGVATVAGEISVTTLDIGGTNVAATAAELNIMDGGTAASSVTLADADRLVTNDDGTMKQVALSTLKTYLTSAGFSSEDPTALAIALG